jgi:hypothetical protein
VKSHSVICCISLYKGFLLNLGSYPRCWTDGLSDRRQENLPPVSKGCFIVLAKSDVLMASHRLIEMRWDKSGVTAILRQETLCPAKKRLGWRQNRTRQHPRFPKP